MVVDRLEIAVERFKEAELYDSVANKFERFAAKLELDKRVVYAVYSVAAVFTRAIFVESRAALAVVSMIEYAFTFAIMI